MTTNPASKFLIYIILFYILLPIKPLYSDSWQFSLIHTYQKYSNEYSDYSAVSETENTSYYNEISITYNVHKFDFSLTLPVVYTTLNEDLISNDQSLVETQQTNNYGISDFNGSINYHIFNENYFIPGILFSLSVIAPTGDGANNLGLNLWQSDISLQLHKWISRWKLSLHAGTRLPLATKEGVYYWENQFIEQPYFFYGAGIGLDAFSYFYIQLDILYNSRSIYETQQTTFARMTMYLPINRSIGLNLSGQKEILMLNDDYSIAIGINYNF